MDWTCQEYDSFGEGGKEHLKAKKVKAQIEKACGVSRPGRLRCLVICICSAFCGNLLTFSFDMVIWLVVWNMAFIFPYIGNNNPNWLSYFSEGLKPPTSYRLSSQPSFGHFLCFFAGLKIKDSSGYFNRGNDDHRKWRYTFFRQTLLVLEGLGVCWFYIIWLVVWNIFYFPQYLGWWSNLTNIFHGGWNHQLVILLNWVRLSLIWRRCWRTRAMASRLALGWLWGWGKTMGFSLCVGLYYKKLTLGNTKRCGKPMKTIIYRWLWLFS